MMQYDFSIWGTASTPASATAGPEQPAAVTPPSTHSGAATFVVGSRGAELQDTSRDDPSGGSSDDPSVGSADDTGLGQRDTTGGTGSGNSASSSDSSKNRRSDESSAYVTNRERTSPRSDDPSAALTASWIASNSDDAALVSRTAHHVQVPQPRPQQQRQPQQQHQHQQQQPHGEPNVRPCNITVSGIPRGVDSRQLSRAFAKHGSIASAMVMLDTHSGRSRGFGFVWFEKDSEARKAVAATHGCPASVIFPEEAAAAQAAGASPKCTLQWNQVLRVFPSARVGALPDTKTVLVTNWPAELDEAAVRSAMGACGPVDSVELGNVSALRKHPVRAVLVVFGTMAAARRAVGNYHGVRTATVHNAEVELPIPLVTKLGAPLPSVKCATRAHTSWEPVPAMPATAESPPQRPSEPPATCPPAEYAQRTTPPPQPTSASTPGETTTYDPRLLHRAALASDMPLPAPPQPPRAPPLGYPHVLPHMTHHHSYGAPPAMHSYATGPTSHPGFSVLPHHHHHHHHHASAAPPVAVRHVVYVSPPPGVMPYGPHYSQVPTTGYHPWPPGM